MKLVKYRCDKEEFESMTKMEKRNYILQISQEETNFWLTFMAKISVISFFVGLSLAFLAILSNIK
jgi:hypothetical protein